MADLGGLSNRAPVAKSLLERAGFKVEMQSMDWQSMVNRLIAKKGPPSEGGWNAFATSWVQVDILDPLMTPFLTATCEKARAGWPCDAAMEHVRDAYARATDPAEKRRIATEAQVLNTQVVTHIPLGEWYVVSVVRANIAPPNPRPPVTVFWGVEKKYPKRHPALVETDIVARCMPIGSRRDAPLDVLLEHQPLGDEAARRLADRPSSHGAWPT